MMDAAEQQLSAPTSGAATAPLSRAAVRRLAHDAQKRLTKHSYEHVLAEVDHFLQKILHAAYRACQYSRKRSIAREHILYSANALGLRVPEELQNASRDDLLKLRKCNLHAPSKSRKSSVLHAEVSEASFSRVSKLAASTCKKNLRLSAPARHLLQLLTEDHILQFFSDNHALASDMTEDLSTKDALQGALDCSQSQAACVTHFVTRLMNQVPTLLQIGNSKTIDERLVLAASGSLVPELVISDTCSNKKNLLRICERILRGRAADKRVTSGAARALASILESLVQHNVTPHIVTSIYEPVSAKNFETSSSTVCAS